MPITPDEARRAWNEAHRFEDVFLQIDDFLKVNYDRVNTRVGADFQCRSDVIDEDMDEIARHYPAWGIRLNRAEKVITFFLPRPVFRNPFD